MSRARHTWFAVAVLAAVLVVLLAVKTTNRLVQSTDDGPRSDHAGLPSPGVAVAGAMNEHVPPMASEMTHGAKFQQPASPVDVTGPGDHSANSDETATSVNLVDEEERSWEKYETLSPEWMREFIDFCSPDRVHRSIPDCLDTMLTAIRVSFATSDAPGSWAQVLEGELRKFIQEARIRYAVVGGEDAVLCNDSGCLVHFDRHWDDLSPSKGRGVVFPEHPMLIELDHQPWMAEFVTWRPDPHPDTSRMTMMRPLSREGRAGFVLVFERRQFNVEK